MCEAGLTTVTALAFGSITLRMLLLLLHGNGNGIRPGTVHLRQTATGQASP